MKKVIDAKEDGDASKVGSVRDGKMSSRYLSSRDPVELSLMLAASAVGESYASGKVTSPSIIANCVYHCASQVLQQLSRNGEVIRAALKSPARL